MSAKNVDGGTQNKAISTLFVILYRYDKNADDFLSYIVISDEISIACKFSLLEPERREVYSQAALFCFTKMLGLKLRR